MVQSLSVIIPSRLERTRSGQLFLANAVQSIRAQADTSITVQILVGIDAGAIVPPDMAGASGVTFIESKGRSQASALNAAARACSGESVAFLEDDDRWYPGYLDAALALMRDFDFCSSTQLEIDEDGQIERINDFPTPSGWLMRNEMWNRVGPFSEEYRFHLDNEWLGRLGEANARRVHLVEATAPIAGQHIESSRPLLAQLLRYGRPKVSLARHRSPWPLIERLCHSGSGYARIQSDPSLKARSEQEFAALHGRFGHVPW
jgi:hypothetical protein